MARAHVRYALRMRPLGLPLLAVVAIGRAGRAARSGEGPGVRASASGSTRFAAVWHIRRPRQVGQNPQPLQLNATRCCSTHASHFMRAKPRQSSPQSR